LKVLILFVPLRIKPSEDLERADPSDVQNSYCQGSGKITAVIVKELFS